MARHGSLVSRVSGADTATATWAARPPSCRVCRPCPCGVLKYSYVVVGRRRILYNCCNVYTTRCTVQHSSVPPRREYSNPRSAEHCEFPGSAAAPTRCTVSSGTVSYSAPKVTSRFTVYCTGGQLVGVALAVPRARVHCLLDGLHYQRCGLPDPHLDATQPRIASVPISGRNSAPLAWFCCLIQVSVQGTNQRLRICRPLLAQPVPNKRQV